MRCTERNYLANYMYLVIEFSNGDAYALIIASKGMQSLQIRPIKSIVNRTRRCYINEIPIYSRLN
jgi:hypothetical protein